MKVEFGKKEQRKIKSQHLAEKQESRVLFSVPSRTIFISVDAAKQPVIQPDFYASSFQGKAFVNTESKLRGWL